MRMFVCRLDQMKTYLKTFLHAPFPPSQSSRDIFEPENVFEVELLMFELNDNCQNC